MGKFSNEAQELLEHIGGKENISAVSHCATRMRFVLNDNKKADVEKIRAIKCVKGTFTQAGQFQVIIGNEVATFYNDFSEVSGVEGVSKDAAKNTARQNMNVVQNLISHLAEVFTPLIPAIVVGGLILGFRNIIGDIKLVEEGTKTLIQVSQFWAGVHSFLWLIGEAIFAFLPVGITWSITKKMGATPILGIVLGITLVSPQLLNAYAVAGAKEIPVWDFGFAQVKMIGYQAQVIPAVLAGLVFAKLELSLRKVVPEYISMIVVPFLALVPTVLLAHTVLGPIGWKIGSAISTVVYAGLTSTFKCLFAALFGFIYAPLVITGLHHMTNAIDLQLMSQFKGTNLWPMIALSNIAQGSAVLAIIYLNRKNEEEKQVSIPAAISCYLGVTEPAMFGINLKYIYPFLAAMIGSAIAAVISVGSGVMANSIGVGGLPGILSIKPQYIMPFLLAMVVAIVVPFVLTIVFSKKNIAVNKEKILKM
ncbi:PTS system trehalose-specific EIIBC component [Clostridium sp. ZS2-4]|uniref:PTS system trehalose-specific EIIBC component n=1 Tax=Clostridium sp. ZS2-4 TaxID=2987703 RepID=UPI00227A027C|nr:PTS system trehalose-specific EIIBC component [Clostridium sp. ZS2-4]MCY6355182.1 PTS system trehalose-specific EIIBC component [Clostridium sp. ZS2-4]